MCSRGALTAPCEAVRVYLGYRNAILRNTPWVNDPRTYDPRDKAARCRQPHQRGCRSGPHPPKPLK
jgi:hypothetical protein